MKEKNTLIVIILLVFITVFYWYSIRPSNIKKDCHEVAVFSAQEWYRENTPNIDGKTGEYNHNIYEKYYSECLNKSGF